MYFNIYHNQAPLPVGEINDKFIYLYKMPVVHRLKISQHHKLLEEIPWKKMFHAHFITQTAVKDIDIFLSIFYQIDISVFLTILEETFFYLLLIMKANKNLILAFVDFKRGYVCLTLHPWSWVLAHFTQGKKVFQFPIKCLVTGT